MNKKNIIITCIVLLVLIFADVGMHLIKESQINHSNRNNGSTNNNHNYELAGNDEYIFNVIKAVNKYQNTNYLISPYSIEIALNMLGQGANGNTKTEIYNVLPHKYEIIAMAKNKISVANALFIRDEYKDYINNEYYSKIKDKYDAEIIYDKFNTPNKINEWVNNKTYEMIPKILDNIDKDFVLGLADALAIDVKWRYKFECNNTKSEKFTQTNGKTINAEMMNTEINRSNAVKYIKNDDLEGVILPYLSYDINGNETNNDNHLEFMAIMPNENIYTYISKLNNEKYENINNAFKSGENVQINLALPRFSYDFNLSNFINILKELGIVDVFNPAQADLTGIMSRENMDKANINNLYVGEAIHKTHIDLNEEGTKAAAVTYIGIYKNTSVKDPDLNNISLNFNKPFLYMIRDNKTKEVLFTGVVEKPNEWKGSTCDK